MPAPAAEDPVELLRLGAQLLGQGRPAEAAAPLYRAVALDPGGVDGHYILGLAQQGLGQHELAIASYARAIELYPAGHAEAHNNLGNVLQSLGRCEEALAHFDAALAAEPRYALAMNNRGNALKALGRYRDAIASHRAALAVDPADALAHFSIGLAQLALGEFDEGWSEYEWRYPHAGAQPRSEVPRAWNGEDLRGRSILLHGEQGLGDSIQFARYAPLVADLGATVVLQVQPALVPLLQNVSGVRRVCGLDAPAPAHDFQCPLMSLPFAFATDLATVPAGIPYLAAPRERLEHWKGRIPVGKAMRVGLVWSGSAAHQKDHERSIAFARLAPLLAVPGVQFVSLQTEIRTGDAAAVKDAAIADAGGQFGDFADTAAAVSQLDLISVDTSVAHLAGALGKPVWILLQFSPDWRWLLEREDSPWYPSARLFRQGAARDWGEVIARVAAALRATAAA